jgi:glycosyltransferase involved in cell wall biosynthesis
MLLSVIIPVYNGKKYLRSAIQSVLQEGMPSSEIIVVDDGSTDRCMETIADLSVQKITLPRNMGQAHAQNIGIGNARGQFVTFLDSDDIMAGSSLQWRCEWLMEHTEEHLVAGRMAGIVDRMGKYMGSYQEILNPAYRTPPSVITEAYLKSGGEFPSQTWLMLFKKTLLHAIGPFDETLLCAHDNDYFYRILKKTSIPFVDRPVAYYRIHDGNFSGEMENGKFVLRRKFIAENMLVHLSHGILPKT